MKDICAGPCLFSISSFLSLCFSLLPSSLRPQRDARRESDGPVAEATEFPRYHPSSPCLSQACCEESAGPTASGMTL